MELAYWESVWKSLHKFTSKLLTLLIRLSRLAAVYDTPGKGVM